MDLSQLFQRAARHFPENVAVVGPASTLRYRELDDRARRLAHGLRVLGLHPGDRVVVLLNNRVEYVEVDVALAYGGFVRVGLNCRLGSDDFATIIEDSGARAIISEHVFDEIVNELARDYELIWLRCGDESLQSDSPATGYEHLVDGSRAAAPLNVDLTSRPGWMPYTSGTTGRPKGVVLTHHALAHTAFNLMLETGPYSEKESILLPQPLSHGAGYFAIAYIASGAAVHVVSGFDPDEICSRGRSENIQTIKLVPTMLKRLLESHKPSPFSKIIYGASPIPPAVLEDALDHYGRSLVQIYGQSEAPATITILGQGDHATGGERLASAGRPWRSVEVKIVDGDGTEVLTGETGELVVKGQHVMSEYYGQHELTSEVLRDGWLWTKDLAVADDLGYIYLRGRRDDIINSGGFNIAPKEVEDVIIRHPDIQDCAVVGAPDAAWGQTVKAYVVPIAGRTISSSDLSSYCAPILGYRQPRSFVIVDDLPHNAYGKVDRNELVRRSVGERAPEGLLSVSESAEER
jgi:fatty-acyl-CoA synthase